MASQFLSQWQQFLSQLEPIISPQSGTFLAQMLANLEKKTNLKREYYLYGCVTLLSVYLIFGYFAQIICNFIGFAYPAYQSFKAIRSPQKDDDTQWLTYWTVFAVFSLVDFFSEKIIGWFPFYWLVKCIFLLYLSLPQFKGAEKIYEKVLEPMFVKYEKDIFGILVENEIIDDETKKCNVEMKTCLDKFEEEEIYKTTIVESFQTKL